MVLVEEQRDDVLGKGWAWSRRRHSQVNSSQYRMKAMNGCIYFRVKRTKHRGLSWVKVEESEQVGSNIIVSMAVITRFPDAVATLDGRYRDALREHKA